MATHKKTSGLSISEQIQDIGTIHHISGQNLIFLISLPRSGSTLLQRILATHQDICTTSEPWLMLHPLNALKQSDLQAKYDHPLAIGALKDFLNNFPEGDDLYYQAVRSYGLTFYRRFLERSGKRLFLDKTPRYYRIIQELNLTFPDARFIILLRNPIAILSSVLKTWCGNDIATLTRSSNYLDMIEGPQLVIDGIDALKEKVSVVSYENLVMSPSETIQKLCDFIKIGYVDDMLNYGSHAAPKGRYGDPVTIHRHDRPVKNFLNKWMTNLSDPNLLHFAKEYLQSIGQETINRLGYDFHEIVSGFKSIENKNISNDVPTSVAITLPGHGDAIDSYDELVRSISKDEPSISIKKVSEFIKHHPDNALAYNDLGVLHYQQNKMKEALESYRKAVALDPDNNILKKNLADHLYFTLRKDQEALNIYVNLLKFDPHDAEVLLAIAHLCLTNKKLEDSRDFCNQILRIDSDNQEAIGLLQLINIERGDRHPSEAVSKTARFQPFSNKPAATVSPLIPMSTEAIVNPPDHNRTLAPVIIYQMGKVGSTSVMNSLNQIGIPNQHIHRLSWSGIAQAEERIREKGITKIPARLIRYREFRNYLENQWHSTRWKVITLVRDPLPRQISCIFQNLNVLLPNVLQINNLSKQCNSIEDYLSNYLSTFDESDDDACNWFDTELKDVFGFDIFSTPFDKKRGYTIYQTENADILAMRIEQLSDCAREAFKDFLGIDNFRLVNANVSNEKPYHELYKQFFAEFKVSKDLLYKFYDTRFVRHFYTSEEIENFKKRWIPRESIESSKQSTPHYRVSAVVSTYKSERFIEGRLQNLIDQTLFKNNELEIIVVDSNSPENEQRIVEQFADQYPNVVYHRTPERETVYAAWNRGISIARGTYFVNANTDDRFTPDALEIMSDILDTHPDYDATYGNWVVTRTPNDTFESGKAKRLFEYPEFHPGLFFYLQITSHANFVRRSVFEQIGNFDGSYTVFGDREFMFRFSAAGFKAFKIDKTVGLYLENPTSVERSNKDIGLQECSALYDFYLAPERFAGLMGHGNEAAPRTLSKDYTKVGCFGMRLYCVDGKSLHALGSPTQLFAKAIELNPDNVEALNNMGVIAQHRQVSQDATRLFNNARAIAQDTQKKVIDHNLKLARRGVSDPDQLRFLFPSDFRPIPVTDSNYHSGRRNLKPLAAKTAKVNLKKQGKGSNSGYRPVKKRASASKRRNIPGRQTVVPLNDGLLGEAWNDYLKDNVSSALTSLRHHLADKPEHWPAYELLVDVMLQSGQGADISKQLRPLENCSGMPARMLALIGSGYEAAGDLSRALHFADQALESDTNCARGWNLKGIIDYRNGHHEAAVRHFQKASECDASWGDPWTNLGTIYWEQGKTVKALDCFEKGFRLSPTTPNVATTYHIAISETGQYKRAKSLFKKTVKQHPDFRKAHFLLIDILIRLEAYLEALNQIETVLAHFGANPQLLEAAKEIRSKVGPMTVKSTKHPTLSLCMIVKNEEKYLPRCLESLKPMVDEMIVVDTGSTDATRDIAEVFGAKVFDFEWKDDFATARNYSLDQASGDWILVMDADEVIAPMDHKALIGLLRKTSLNKSTAYMMTTRNYTDRQDSADYAKNIGEYQEEKSTGWVPSKKVRLLRNHQGVHFVFPVHEQVDPVLVEKGVTLKECSVPVHHYGKLDIRRTADRWKLYYDIGKEKLKSQPTNENALKELAIQAGLLSKWEESARCWENYLDLKPGSIDACLNLTRVMANAGKFDQANQYALKAFGLSPDKPEPFYNLALSELQTGQPAKAVKTVREMMAKFPNDTDGKLLCAVAEMCSGNVDAGLNRVRHLAETLSGKSLLPRIRSIMYSIRSAGYQDWAERLVIELSQIDGLQDLEKNAEGVAIQETKDRSKMPNAHNENLLGLYDEACRFFEGEDYRAAFETLRHAIEIRPDHWTAYGLLVDVMLQSGQAAAITEQLRPLEERSDLPARALALVGSGYEAAGDLSRAAEFADRAIALDADCPRAWNLKGVLAYRSGDVATARQLFKAAADKDADWGEPWTNLGTIHWEQQSSDKALDCFEKGFRLSPTAPNVATTYHIAVNETGQYDRAKSIFLASIARYPDFRKGRFLLIDILIRLKAYTAALEQIETVMVRFGTDSQLLEAAKAVRDKVGPMTIEKGKHPTLSLCMIVKNEEKYLPRCLESLSPMVDEMIVVDTGSTDSTRDIAEIFGAKVFDFKWEDDFAAARNFSLEQASGDWILVMDADEVIAAEDHKHVRKLTNKTSSNRHAFMVLTRNYTNQNNIIGWEPNAGQYPAQETGTGWIPSEKVRLFPKDDAIRFEYPVHEVVGPALARKGISVKSCPYPVHHYGKMDQALDRQKDERYYTIGIEKLSIAPNDPVAIREMAIQAGKLGKDKDAIDLWKRLLELQPNTGKSYINLSSNYGKLKRYREAREAAQMAIKLSPNIKEGHLNLGMSELHLGNLQKAENIFNKIANKSKKYYSAIFLLGASQLCQGKMDKGVKTLQLLRDTSIGKSLSFAVQELAESLMAAGCSEASGNLIDSANKLNGSNDEITEHRRQRVIKAA